jgi:hypothetical protein
VVAVDLNSARSKSREREREEATTVVVTATRMTVQAVRCDVEEADDGGQDRLCIAKEGVVDVKIDEIAEQVRRRSIDVGLVNK